MLTWTLIVLCVPRKTSWDRIATFIAVLDSRNALGSPLPKSLFETTYTVMIGPWTWKWEHGLISVEDCTCPNGQQSTLTFNLATGKLNQLSETSHMGCVWTRVEFQYVHKFMARCCCRLGGYDKPCLCGIPRVWMHVIISLAHLAGHTPSGIV